MTWERYIKEFIGFLKVEKGLSENTVRLPLVNVDQKLAKKIKNCTQLIHK